MIDRFTASAWHLLTSHHALLAQTPPANDWLRIWIINGLTAFGLTALGVLGYLILAVIISLNARHIAWGIVSIARRLSGRERPSEQRVQTIHQLYTSLISILGALFALIGILRIFVDSTQLVWIVGLFSAAFGWGARSLVSDIIAGTNYIFQNTFAIGEKLEFWLTASRVEGIVERVSLRYTHLRATTGELLTVPNGSIDVIRNYTRAAWSGAQLRVRVPTAKLGLAISTLNALARESQSRLVHLIEPWQLLLINDEIGEETELTINARFEFGTAALSRPVMAQEIHNALRDAGVISAKDELPVA